MEKNPQNEIIDRMNIIILLLLRLTNRDLGDNFRNYISTLMDIGVPAALTAKIVNKDVHYVTATISQLKKTKGKKRAK